MLIGNTLGKYRVTEHLGSGGMSEVYKAYQPGLDRYVAIKVLHSFLAAEEDFLTRFKREAKVAAMLRHPNIVQVYDFDYADKDNVYYMVMEFIDGPNLKALLREMSQKNQLLSMEEAVRIVTSIANGLDYAHQRGAVHRDVKPGNIMFTQDDGQVILTDFGIAKMVDVAGLTASGAMVGTPAYMAPEQGMGQAGDERADIYSLGVVLYQLTTGRLPFDADTPLGIALKHINAPLPLPTVLNPKLPSSVEAVILRALTKNPEHRYQTAQEFSTELKQAVAGEVIEPPPPEHIAVSKSPSGEEHEWKELNTDRPSVLPKNWEAATLPSAPIYRPPWVTTTPPENTLVRRKRRRLTFALVTTMILLLLAGLTACFMTGTAGRIMSAMLAQVISPTPTLPPDALTPTANAIATQVVAALATQNAEETLEATRNYTLTPPPTATSTPTRTPSPTPTPDLTATVIAGYRAEVLRNLSVWPTTLMPGQQFVKRWTVRNAGPTTWPPNAKLVYVSGEEFEVVETTAIEPLPPGESTTIAITLRAPVDYGTYTGLWELQDGSGNLIGEGLSISCYVGSTPTPTSSPMPTVTPLPISTPTPMDFLRVDSAGLIEGSEVKLDNGDWIADVYVVAQGGDGIYHFYIDSVAEENEFFAPGDPSVGIYRGGQSRQGSTMKLKFVITSAWMTIEHVVWVPYPG